MIHSSSDFQFNVRTHAASQAFLSAFTDRGITFVPERFVSALNLRRRVVVLDDSSEMPYGLFLGVPKHCAPEVVTASGLTEEGWIPVDPKTLKTHFPDVYAVGDVASVGTPLAGVFSEGAAKVVAAELIAKLKGEESPPAYSGIGSCYAEFGHGKVGRIEVDFLSGPKAKGNFEGPSATLANDKQSFGSSRRKRWFGF